MAMTTRSAVLSFQLQMSEQSRKFGHRVRERREELERDEPGRWQAKHVVARMHDHGDLAINTNQLSRYESGNGPFPRENRQEAFAYALKTTAGDLIAGPLAERLNQEENVGDLMESLSDAQGQADLQQQVAEYFEALRAELGEKLDKLNDEVKALRQSAESSGRTRKSSGK
jgi:transcriptional regulator with XRE-family HTH domain